MLANVQPQGADLLLRVIDAATARARTMLGERLALNACEDVTLRKDCADTVLEAWCVCADAHAATISAFATGHDADGRRHIVAAGRFTFTAIPTGQHE
jgi:hypothetical protein